MVWKIPYSGVKGRITDFDLKLSEISIDFIIFVMFRIFATEGFLLIHGLDFEEMIFEHFFEFEVNFFDEFESLLFSLIHGSIFVYNFLILKFV